VTVNDRNGAAIRYEGGGLTLSNDYFHDNQEGLLVQPIPTARSASTTANSPTMGDGSGSTTTSMSARSPRSR